MKLRPKEPIIDWELKYNIFYKILRENYKRKERKYTMNVLDIIVKFLKLSAPFIAKLIASKVVPKAKRKAYELLDGFVDDRIEDLVKLVNKAKNEKDGVKKAAHIEGLRLGVATLKAICTKLEIGLNHLNNILNVDCLSQALDETLDIEPDKELEQLAANIEKEVGIA
jgi:hypothetical protein